MKYCRNCGKEIHEEAVICPHCGVQQQRVQDTKGYRKGLLISCFFNLFVGFAGGTWALLTYTDDTSRLWGYTYQAPLTFHEWMVIVIGICSVVFIVIGVAQCIDLIRKK